MERTKDPLRWEKPIRNEAQKNRRHDRGEGACRVGRADTRFEIHTLSQKHPNRHEPRPPDEKFQKHHDR
jgi:hypothetical protein